MKKQHQIDAPIIKASIKMSILYPFFRYGESDRGSDKEKQGGWQLLVATFKHMKKPYQLLIIPLTFWSGVEQGFFGADYTAVSFSKLFTLPLCHALPNYPIKIQLSPNLRNCNLPFCTSIFWPFLLFSVGFCVMCLGSS